MDKISSCRANPPIRPFSAVSIFLNIRSGKRGQLLDDEIEVRNGCSL